MALFAALIRITLIHLNF
ncbi:hypothetical protein [Burkholderia sp. AU18528]